MWQAVFAHIPIKGRVIDSDVNGLLDGSGNAMSLPSYDLEILKLSTDGFVASCIVMIKNWWWCF